MTEVMTTWAISRAKFQSQCHHQQTNTQLFTGQMPYLSPNQQCQSAEWNTQRRTQGQHTGSCHHHPLNGCILQCQEKPSWVLNIVETFGRSGLRPEPHWGSSQHYPDPLAGGQGDDVPSPKNPSPLSAFGPTSCLPMKNPGHTPENTLLSVSYQVSDLWLLVHLGHRHTFHEHTTCCFRKTSSQMLSVLPLWYTPQSPDPNSASDGRSWRHVTRPTPNQQPGKGQGQAMYTWYSAFSWNTTSEALMYGTCFQGISQFYLHTLKVHSQSEWAIPAFVLLSNYSWYSFADPGGMEGWVGIKPDY